MQNRFTPPRALLLSALAVLACAPERSTEAEYFPLPVTTDGGTPTVCGSTEPPVALQVKLETRSCTPGINPLAEVATVRVTVFGDGIDSRMLQASVAAGEPSVSLPALRLACVRMVVAEGLSSAGTLLSRGAVAPLDPSARSSRSLAISLRRVNQFDRAHPLSNPIGCSVLGAARAGHTATTLENGNVLIAGGYHPGSARTYLTSTELYNPVTGAITPGPSMHLARARHTATHLPGTKYTLIAGGEGATPPDAGKGALQSGELYDEETNTFAGPYAMTAARTRHTAALPLPVSATDHPGAIFLLGGLKSDGSGSGATEIFDRDNGFLSAPLSFMPRAEAAAVALPGRVVLIGGWGGLGAPSPLLSIEGVASLDGLQFNALTGATTLSAPHIHPAAAPLGDGSIVVLGGFSAQSGVEPALADATGAGEVLAADLKGREPLPSELAPRIASPRAFAGAVSLPNGTVLVGGGGGSDGAARNDTFLVYRTARDAVLHVAEQGGLLEGRIEATWTTLLDGTVLVTGGYHKGEAGSEALNSVEVFQPPYRVEGNNPTQ